MATIVVIAQGVMIVTSLIAMKVASKRNYWPVILVSFMFLPIRGVLAFFLTGWWGVAGTPVFTLSARHDRALAEWPLPHQPRPGRLHHGAGRRRIALSGPRWAQSRGRSDGLSGVSASTRWDRFGR